MDLNMSFCAVPIVDCGLE